MQIMSVMRKSVIALYWLFGLCGSSAAHGDDTNQFYFDMYKNHFTVSHRAPDCGFPGITENKCLEDRHCAFNKYRKPQCYFTSERQPCCNIRPIDRIQCTYPCIDLEVEPYFCRSIGCCFNAEFSYGAPRCFKTEPDCCQQLAANNSFQRVDAGFPGITEEKCKEAANSCFNNKKRGITHCFYKYPPLECDVPEEERLPCPMSPNGEFETEPHQCRMSGCCFSSKDRARPRCFVKKTEHSALWKIIFAMRSKYVVKIDCGFPGITRAKCLEDDSCMFSTHQRGPTCFFKPGMYSKQCCDVDEAARTKCVQRGYNLEKEPYLCRQLGCCFSAANNASPRCFKSASGCCQSLARNALISRIDAGYPGISQEKCEQLGNTCFSPISGYVHCFYKFSAQRCNVARRNRKQCRTAYKYIDRVRCLAAGCCYDPKPKNGSPRCYEGNKENQSQ